jgi:hypothetical protein
MEFARQWRGAAASSILRADTATPDAHPRMRAWHLIIVGSEPARAPKITWPERGVRGRLKELKADDPSA